MQTDMPKSKVIPLLCVVYGLFAIAGIYVAVLGHYSKPAPLPLIDETVGKPQQLEQAKSILAQAEKQAPTNEILSEFYYLKGLERKYERLVTYVKPAYDGDSFEERLTDFNEDAKRILDSWDDAIITLSFLSVGGLILIVIMLRSPGYLVALLLGAFPLLVVFTCLLLDINYKELENCDNCWPPFIALGAIIFLLQFIFSFRFGRPEHRTVEGLPGLMIYRRGLFLLNFGAILLVSALLMAGGSLSSSGHSSYTRLGLALFGEGGIVALGLIAGTIMAILGLYYLTRKPSDKVL